MAKITKSTEAQVTETVTQTEQVNSLSTTVESVVKVAIMANDIAYIKGDIAEIKIFFKDMKLHFVSRDEFAPVRNVVYGMVGIILLAVVGALVALVVMH